MSDSDILFLHALTGLHPGAGTALGVVDLPVQRERHTQWPIVQASSLKGVLRSACREKLEPDEWLAMFGPETANASDFAGAVSLTDARLLAFPVRSLRGVFAWITCSAVLERLRRDASLVAAPQPGFGAFPGVERHEAACAEDGDLLVDGHLVLEELEFRCSGSSRETADWVASHAVNDDATSKRLRRHLVVLHDDDFTWFVRHATEVVARVGLDSETKTAKSGALFYEEFLPPETLFYSLVLAQASRNQDVDRASSRMLALLRESIPPVLQVGADETIGRGLCATAFLSGCCDGSASGREAE